MNDHQQYYSDIITGLAERTIKRLWIVIILLIILLVGTNAMWIYRNNQYEEAVITQEVLQEVDGENSRNYFNGGDYYVGASEGADNG